MSATSDSMIAHLPPADGRNWDCQCARCGSSVFIEYDDLIDLGPIVWRTCASGPDWCDAHPLPGREDVQRPAVEWFVPKGGA